MIDREALWFFHEHAGWVTPPGRLVCARDLAHAEAWGKERGAVIIWEWDEDGFFWEGEDGPDEVLCCIVEVGNKKTSLYRITDPDDNYRRVEAQLLQELMS